MKCGMPTGQHGNPVLRWLLHGGGLKEGSAQARRGEAPLPRRGEQESEAERAEQLRGRRGRIILIKS